MHRFVIHCANVRHVTLFITLSPANYNTFASTRASARNPFRLGIKIFHMITSCDVFVPSVLVLLHWFCLLNSDTNEPLIPCFTCTHFTLRTISATESSKQQQQTALRDGKKVTMQYAWMHDAWMHHHAWVHGCMNACGEEGESGDISLRASIMDKCSSSLVGMNECRDAHCAFPGPASALTPPRT